MSSLSSLVRGVVQLDPPAPAIEYKGKWMSWGDVSRVMDALAETLTQSGLGPGTRVAGMLRNHPLMAATLLEVISSDRCVVTLNPSLPDDRLVSDIENLRPPVIVGLAQDWGRTPIREAAHRIRCLGVMVTPDASEPVRLVEGLEEIRGEDLKWDATGVAIEMLTSGTTGAPKRIPLTAEAFSTAIAGAGVFDGRKPDDPPTLRKGVPIVNAPFAHISGVFGLFNCVSAGRSFCLLERFTVTDFVDAVRRHRLKVAGAPPSALRMILDAGVPKEDLSSLVAFRAGTAPLDPDLADEFHARYGIPVLQNYGATEFAGRVAGWTLRDFLAHNPAKRGSVGRLNPDVEARVVDPETSAALGLGEVGLLQLRAPQLGDGASWVKTTDLAQLDADDFLWIRGRYDNAIIRGGFKMLPDDVVRALETHPAIREAAVVGLTDPRLGQVPVAAYILRSGAGPPPEDELNAFLREKLLPYQVPTRPLRVEELPRTPSMKVSQPDLRALFETAHA